MFRTLRFYRLLGEWPEDENALTAALQSKEFKPCGAFSEKSIGFEAPTQELADQEILCRTVAGCDLLQMRIQTRLLPAGVVNEQLIERVDAFKSRTGRDPGRKEKRELKEEVYGELLPKALLKSDRVQVVAFRNENVIAITTPSANTAEELLGYLREALGSLQIVPLEYRRSAHELLTQIFLGQGPEDFVLGRECRMKDSSEYKSIVNWQDMDLGARAVRAHVNEGLLVDRLAVRFDTVLTAVLDEDLVVRKLKLEGLEELDDADEEEPLARLDAEFTLYTGVVRRLLESLKKNLGGFAT